MKKWLFLILLIFLFSVKAYAVVTIRNDKTVEYIVVYYATVYSSTVYNDKAFEYIIIPGDFDSEDFSFSYEMAPDMYPVSQGLIYRWRIQKNEWHHRFKKGFDSESKKEF